MTIQEITVRDLPAFVESSLYKGSDVKPVTPERVLSQIHNPRAKPGDVVLIVAYTDEGRLAGFTGMLPDAGNSADGRYRFAWNSGWWIDPLLGKGIALKLLYRSIQSWKGLYLITDLTPHTRSIIELTRLFSFTELSEGIRLQVLSDFSGKVMRHYRPLTLFRCLFSLIDKFVNIILRGRLNNWKRENEPSGLTIEYLQKIDNDCLSFIEKHNTHELCRRSKSEFEWIISYPWLVSNKSAGPAIKYPFSRECGFFENILTKIMYNGKIAGIVFLTNRDGLFRIPYLYADQSKINLVSNAVFKILIEKKATDFCTFRHEIMEYIEKNAFPVFYKMSVYKELAISKTIIQKQPEKYDLQDGDGDVVFT